MPAIVPTRLTANPDAGGDESSSSKWTRMASGSSTVRVMATEGGALSAGAVYVKARSEAADWSPA